MVQAKLNHCSRVWQLGYSRIRPRTFRVVTRTKLHYTTPASPVATMMTGKTHKTPWWAEYKYFTHIATARWRCWVLNWRRTDPVTVFCAETFWQPCCLPNTSAILFLNLREFDREKWRMFLTATRIMEIVFNSNKNNGDSF